MEKQGTLNEKLEYISYLDNLLRETKEQNESLSKDAVEGKSRVDLLQKELSEEQSKARFLTEKLFVNKQVMRRLHKEFSEIVNEAGEESLVISL
jgi:hypothetical protein